MSESGLAVAVMPCFDESGEMIKLSGIPVPQTATVDGATDQWNQCFGLINGHVVNIANILNTSTTRKINFTGGAKDQAPALSVNIDYGNESWHDSPTYNGLMDVPEDGNDAGITVGQLFEPPYRSCLTAAAPIVWAGRPIALPTLTTDSTCLIHVNAYGINNLGDIVGCDGDNACLWKDGRIYKLSTLIDNPDGWTLNEARRINDNGYIIGNGAYNGTHMSYLLIPTDPPTSPPSSTVP